MTPADRLTPEWRAAIRAHKAPLLALLGDEKRSRSPGERAEQEEQKAGAARRVLHDPRPDLDDRLHDAVWWSVLLALAHEEYGAADPRGVYGALHVCRCLGAGLVRTRTGGLRLVPGVVSQEEWRRLCTRWLSPHRREVVVLLRAVAEAAALLVEELMGEREAVDELRRVWPTARLLGPAALAELEAQPLVDWRARRAARSTMPSPPSSETSPTSPLAPNLAGDRTKEPPHVGAGG